MIRLRTLALHPFLFAAASVLSLYAANLRELTFSDVATALAMVLGAALVLFLAFGAALRTFGARSAILTSITLVTGLFYAEIVTWVDRLLGGLSSVAALPIMLAILGVLLVLVARLRVDLTLANAALNGFAFVLFVIPTWQAMSYEWRNGEALFFTAEAFSEGGAEPAPERALSVDLVTSKDRPDIYYFIFDRYASESTLTEHYGFDNSEMVDFLKAKGFYVASDSRSNYLKTAHSLASTFHMDYLDFLAEDERNRMRDWHPIYGMLENHRVARFLKAAGYKFIEVGAWWAPTQYNPYADENYSFGFSEFNTLYLQKTIVVAMLNAVVPASTYARSLQWDNGQCQRVPRQIEEVEKIGERSEATFVFAHVLVPHRPYVFDPEGRCLSQEEVIGRGERQGYVEQVQFANSLIKDVVSALLAGKRKKPVIIIQADEGPFPERFRFGGPSWHDATDAELKIKTGILNAYYFPDGEYGDLYQSITPVNTFRMLFNKYFGTDLKRLPDRVYAFPDVFKIYDFFDITDIVNRTKAVEPTIPQRRPAAPLPPMP